jgi:hypothetical protein
MLLRLTSAGTLAKWSARRHGFTNRLPYTPVSGRQYIPDGIDVLKNINVWYKETVIEWKLSRLDLGLTKTISTRRGRKAEWNFSVYNAYNRHNPNAYYYSGIKKDFRIEDWQGNYLYLKKYKVSFFPLIPTISYKLFFDGKPKNNQSMKTNRAAESSMTRNYKYNLCWYCCFLYLQHLSFFYSSRCLSKCDKR